MLLIRASGLTRWGLAGRLMANSWQAENYALYPLACARPYRLESFYSSQEFRRLRTSLARKPKYPIRKRGHAIRKSMPEQLQIAQSNISASSQ
jgi:hypothetical protein